jgi:hypothetical protein
MYRVVPAACRRPPFPKAGVAPSTQARWCDPDRVLDADKLAAFVKVAPVLFHVTPAANVPRIQAEGLRPGSEIGAITRDDFFSTRPGHTYLIGQREIPIVEIDDVPRVFAVELAALDPALINPDEDMVAERFPEMVSVPPPQREINGGVEAPGQRGARAAWAAGTPCFDRTEVTERSLWEGRRIAYRGVIPPNALRLLDTPSPVLAMFESTLSSDVDWSLPEPPLAGGWRVEVARSRAVLGEAARGVLRVVGFDLPVDVAGPEQARATSERLRPVIRGLLQGDLRFAEADAVREAQGAIDAVKCLSGDTPLSDLQVAIEISRFAAAALNALASLPTGDRDQMRQVAIDAHSSGLRAA